MHLFKSMFALALVASSALAQSTQLTYPPSGSCLTAGSQATVQIMMGGFPENIDNVALVIGLAPCFGGECFPASAFMGDILYQGNYDPLPANYFANYTVTIPTSFPSQDASLNAINFFMVGESFVPIVDYMSVNVTVGSCECS